MPQIQTPLVARTPSLDVVSIRDRNVSTEDILELILKLYQSTNDHAIRLNEKDHGIYSLEPYGCCKQYFPAIPGDNNRGIARVTFNFSFAGFSPGTVTIPHGIVFDVDTRIVLMQCVANDPIGQFAIPIPYVDVTTAGAQNIQMNMDNTNVYIVTAGDRTAFTDNFLVIEYTVS